MTNPTYPCLIIYPIVFLYPRKEVSFEVSFDQIYIKYIFDYIVMLQML